MLASRPAWWRADRRGDLRQHAGKPVGSILPRLKGHPAIRDLTFSNATADDVIKTGAKYAFLALPHGLAAEFALPLLNAGLKIVDLSADFPA